MSGEMRNEVRVFAPATVANLGPGYDVLGLALAHPGDQVEARPAVPLGVKMAAVAGESHPPADERNTAWVAANVVYQRLGLDFGVELRLHKGLPVGSGLGSSGASAVAAAVAVNALAGSPLARSELLGACAEAERVACGAAHADNVAPALLGGIVLVRPGGEAIRIVTRLRLWMAMVTPAVELPTRQARAAIPRELPLEDAVFNSAQLAALIYGLSTDDLALVASAIHDRIAEPRRAALIPHFAEVKAAALGAGALGASISGAGPSIFALCGDQTRAEATKEAMTAALQRAQMPHQAWTSPVDEQGARILGADEDHA